MKLYNKEPRAGECTYYFFIYITKIFLWNAAGARFLPGFVLVGLDGCGVEVTPSAGIRPRKQPNLPHNF